MTITFTVEIDWAHDGTWTDETSRTRRVHIKNGFDEPGRAVAAVGRCELTMDNGDQRFSPGYLSSPLYGDLLPRRPVRVSASDGVTTWTLFRGFVDAIRPDAGEWGGKACVIACVDGIALLGQQRIGVAHEDSKAVDEAVSAVVASAYTPPASSYADNGDTLTHYGRAWQPEVTTCLRALREIAEAVYGRFYVARDGTATYLSRDDRQDSSVSAAVILGDVEYWQRVRSLRPYSLVAYWRLNESSGTTVHDSSGNEFDGTASGVTWDAEGIGDNETAARFDGVNDSVDVFSAGLASAFNGAAGTVAAWVKVDAAGVWTDGTYRTVVVFQVDTNNYVQIRKTPNDNQLQWIYKAGGTLEIVNGTSSDVDWLHLVLTWDADADEVNAYLNGVQVGSTQTGLGTWAGSVGTARLGSATAAAQIWDGLLVHAALWDEALDAGEIAQMAGV